jgi:hypothetical protein
MRSTLLLILAPATILLGPVGCSPEDTDEDRCGGDYAYIDGGCIDTAAGDTDSGSSANGWLGAPCACTGDECEMMGMPMPTGGTITGCENVPTPWTGAELGCMQTNASGLGPESWFANGYCTLMAVDCEGDATLCDDGDVGDLSAMTACPAGSAMLTGSGELDVMGFSAVLTSSLCAPLCETNDDCRVGETDPDLGGEPSQYECHELDGVRFCYDPRNLSDDATAVAY